jgi:hypothetical protein
MTSLMPMNWTRSATGSLFNGVEVVPFQASKCRHPLSLLLGRRSSRQVLQAGQEPQ